MATTAGALLIDIVANIAGLRTDLDKGTRDVQKFAADIGTHLRTLTNQAAAFATGLAGIGLAIGGASIANLAKQAIDAADQIGDMADRAGISARALQGLSYVARDVGADTEGLVTGITRLNKTLGEAGAGNKEAIKTFQELGVSFAIGGELRTTEDVIRAVADRIQQAGSVAEQTRIAVAAFGKAGAALVPVLRDGAAGMDTMLAKLEEMGVIVGGQTLKDADALAKTFQKMSESINVQLITALVALKPVLETVAGLFVKAAQGAAQFFDKLALVQSASTKELDQRIEKWQGQLRMLEALPAVAQRALGFEINRLKAAIANAELEKSLRQFQRTAEDMGRGATTGTKITAPGETDAERAKRLRDLEKANQEATKLGLTTVEGLEATLDAAAFSLGTVSVEAAQLRSDFADLAGETVEFAGATMDLGTALGLLTTQQKEVDESAYHLRVQWDAIDKQFKDMKDSSTLTEWGDLSLKVLDTTTGALGETDAAALKAAATFNDRVSGVMDGVRDVFSGVSGAFDGMVQGILQGTQTVALAIDKMATNVVTSLANKFIQRGIKAAEDALMKLLETVVRAGLSAYFGAPATAGAAPATSTLQTSDFQGTLIKPIEFARGGVVKQATFGIVGESGPEAVIPLDQLEGGGGSTVTVNIIDQRKSGTVEQRESTTALGEKQIDVLITDVVAGGIQAGAFDRAMGQSYGLSRRGASR
jgi:hypothetical protein